MNWLCIILLSRCPLHPEILVSKEAIMDLPSIMKRRLL